MLRLSRTTTGLLGIVALLSALTAWDGCAERPADSPLDAIGAWTVPRRHKDLEQEAALQADIMGRSQRLVEVTDEVRAGRLSLLEAAAQVRDIESASPYFPWDHFRMGHAGATDDERFCHMVIELASPGKPVQGKDPVVARLEAELEEHLKNGTLRLP